jgi:hypothetical protein
LITLFYSTGGENWLRNDGWLLRGGPCQWDGVYCSPSGYVVGINLTSNFLQGSLPPELALLAPAPAQRGRPEFRDGGGGGGGSDGDGGFRPPPPPSDGGITEGLATVDLSMNNLTGQLPSRIGNCNNMYVFLVQDNQLTGPIPDISNWTSSLEEASFHGNNFVGEIPLELCSADDSFLQRQLSVDCGSISCDCCNPSCKDDNSTTTTAATQSPQNETTNTTPTSKIF